jgi:hypothetical protein
MVSAAAALRLALVLACIAGTSTLAFAQRPKVIPGQERKFDHERHTQSAGAAVPCSTCHVLDASGAPKAGREHARCAQCHEDDLKARSCDVMKATGPKGAARVCQVCHLPTSARCLPDDLPAKPTTNSYAARFTHGKHLALGSSIERDCALCHAGQAPVAGAKQVAHKLCAGCHNPNGAKPTLAECASCHVAPVARPPKPAAEPYRLTQFDHRAHHTTANNAACLGCHDKLVGSGETSVPRPSMAACQSKCHDGQKAFSAVGTRCTTCHKGGAAIPASLVPKTRPDVAFLHKAHAPRNVRIDNCATCHALETDGRLQPPLSRKEHLPCALSGCHQHEYMSTQSKICGVCHDTIAPWQSTLARPRTPATPEWHESIDHAVHLAKTGTANLACATCHGEKLANAPAPRGHDACSACHGRGQAPPMSQCAACHSQTPAPRARASQWSVRALFSHPKHAKDPRSNNATECVDCHAGVRTAKTLAAIKAPTMGKCDSECHDGKVAFKTTGFQCARCHAPPGGSSGTPTAMLEVRP